MVDTRLGVLSPVYASTTFAIPRRRCGWLLGESIYFVKEQLGHADIQTTINLYGHPDQAEHRAAAERAAAWWRTPAIRPG